MSPDLTAIRALLASVEGFTPGPWRRDGFDVVPARAASEGWQIADCGTANSPDSAPYNATLIAAAPTLHAHLTDLVGEVERLRTRVRHADNVLAAIDGIRAFGEDPADCAARLVSNLLEIKSACHGRPGEHPIAAFRRALAAGELERLRAHNARMVALLNKVADAMDDAEHEAWDDGAEIVTNALPVVGELRALAAGEVDDA